MKPKNPDSTGYPEYSQLNLPDMEKEILLFWEHNKIFEKSVSSRPDDKRFVFYEGPPSANGKPGIHHIQGRTIKDLFCRFKTLQGYKVERKAGWDTHGLPIELNVEKELGITKKDIGTKISVAEYNKHCRADVLKYTDMWEDLTSKMGYWVDMDHPYITCDDKYIESLWALLKILYEKDLLYKGFTIQPYSPAAGTGLSAAELNQPGCYKDVKDITAVAMFKVMKDKKSAFLFDNAEEDVRILAWTTTPWTLPSNVALAVGPGIKYVKAKTVNFYSKQEVSVILAADLLEKTFAWNNLEIKHAHDLGTGKDLVGVKYEQLFPFSQPKGDAFRVIAGDFVTTTDGTGVVHISPVHGADDMRVAKQNGIVTDYLLVNEQGRFTDGVGEFSGEYVKEAYYTDEEKAEEAKKQRRDVYLNVDIRLVDKLKKDNKLFKSEKYEHTYPHCWRTDKPVIYYPLDSWFIKTTAIKDRLIELNKTINWKPAYTGEGRFGQWLENLVDWNLSRSRYWGTPLPIWRTKDGKEEKCIGSIEELKSEVEKAIKAGIKSPDNKEQSTDLTDLHKPHVDEMVLVSDSGQPMYREADLIDVWFDSGAMPYAQWHWPLEGKDGAPFGRERAFPADFIAEGVDQTRGWFFTLHVLGVALFDSVAFKNVVSNGLLLDKNGVKMSKRLGNTVEPFDTIEKYSADATRWYMIRNSDPWDNLKFDLKGIEEITRAHFGTLYNTYGFFALYANIDKFKVNENDLVPMSERTELDRWILSKLQSLIKEVTAYYEDYEPTRAARAIEAFVDAHLSNWYVRLSRRRFWKGDISRDKQAAYETLHECLRVVAQLMSPISPFFSDWLYNNLHDNYVNRGEKLAAELGLLSEDKLSVHLSLLIEADEQLIDTQLEFRMDIAQRICALALSQRKRSNIKVRQPLQKILVHSSEKWFNQLIFDEIFDADNPNEWDSIFEVIKSELNIKEVKPFDAIRKKAKPNFKLLGKRFGDKTQPIANFIKNLNIDQVREIETEIFGTGQARLINFLVDDLEEITILKDEVEFESAEIEGYLTVSKDGLTVALDVNITDALRDEGTAREFINKVQNIRKDKNFQVLDRIIIYVEEQPLVESALKKHYTYIANETLADEIKVEKVLLGFDEMEFNDATIKLKIIQSQSNVQLN